MLSINYDNRIEIGASLNVEPTILTAFNYEFFPS